MNLTKKLNWTFLIPKFLSIKVLSLLLCLTASVLANERTVDENFKNNILKADTTVKGKITDAEKVGLPGVSVLVKGTQKGTTTDGNGNFILSGLKGNEILTISYVGFVPQEITVNGKQTLAIPY